MPTQLFSNSKFKKTRILSTSKVDADYAFFVNVNAVAANAVAVKTVAVNPISEHAVLNTYRQVVVTY